jgi:hypothetical protein
VDIKQKEISFDERKSTIGRARAGGPRFKLKGRVNHDVANLQPQKKKKKKFVGIDPKTFTFCDATPFQLS